MITFEVSKEISTREIREWCKENCIGEYHVKNPQAGYQESSDGRLYEPKLLPMGPYSVKLWSEDDAILFKLTWL